MLVRTNETKRKLAKGQAVFGMMVPVPDEHVVEWLGYTGIDYIIIEAEHSPITVDAAERMVRAAERVGLDTIIRLPDHDPDGIRRFLEVGVQGVMAPRVSSVEIAQSIIQATKFHPVGTRGMGPSRASGYGMEMTAAEWIQRSNEETLIVVQIEDTAGVEALPEIVRLPEIDVISMGPNDLSQSLGVPGQLDHPEVRSSIQVIETLAQEAGKILNDSPLSHAHTRELHDRGYQMLDFSFAHEVVGALSQKIEASRQSIGS